MWQTVIPSTLGSIRLAGAGLGGDSSAIIQFIGLNLILDNVRYRTKVIPVHVFPRLTISVPEHLLSGLNAREDARYYE